MLLIKHKQLKAITNSRRELFIQRLREHLEKFFPDIIKLLTAEEYNSFMDIGTKRATAYGLETEYQIMVYFNIMLTLGVNFEKNKKHKWADKILHDKSDAKMRVETLLRRVESELKNK